MESCIFCKIAKGEIPSKIIYEDALVMAFHDLAPQAPVHVLIVPKAHYASILDVQAGDGLLAHMFEAAQKLAGEIGLSEKGFRLTINTGADGGQTVQHLHMHLLGGRSFGWPPG